MYGSHDLEVLAPVATVVLLGTLDAKGVEYAFLRDRVGAAGCEVNFGPLDTVSPGIADRTLMRYIEVVEPATDSNDPAFARAMAERLDELYRSWAAPRRGERPEEVHDETGTRAATAAAH